MKSIFCWVLFSVMALAASAQRYEVDSSVITFFSDAAIEDIEATNTKASGIFDAGTLQIAFSVPIDQFQFDKRLMQQHFNEKYMESEKFPTSTFSGKVDGFNPETKGSQNVVAKGKLKIHGVTRQVENKGTIDQNSSLVMNAKFIVVL
jgi:polyisoprenoid-binding protein YceI